MIFDKINTILGFIKLLFYKLLYNKRIKFDGLIKIKNGFNLIIDKKSMVKIGNNVKIRYKANIKAENGGEIIIKDNVFINDGIIINALQSIEIEEDVSIGHNVILIDHDHDYKNNFKKFVTKSIKIGKGVWIGANSMILKGVEIGANSVIAAGSIITKNVPENSIIIQKREEKIKSIIRGKNEK